ncbi:MAG: flagellar type III secretion system pore protein FliP [Sulfuriflexus sp.]|nr:flagellar type III secretion system pore protein FliP [Sulfuriflexus sp.]
MKALFSLLVIALGLSLPLNAFAEVGIPVLSVTTNDTGGQTYTLSIQILILMTLMTVLPAALMMMTAFTRVVIVLSILRTAIGTTQAPTNQIIIGLSLFMTIFIMSPVFEKVNSDALQPYLNETITSGQAIEKARSPISEFMMMQTREADIELFASIAGIEEISSPDDIPFRILVPAFVTSELKTAFQIGFLLFVPFLIIDLVVASVLMSMGMMMLSPLIISLPFKIMLFVLADGWTLVLGTLATSFYI